MASSDSGLSRWVTDAVLLAALSVTGYAVAFAFEMGYAAHFGYPATVISPTPATIASALLLLVFGIQIIAQFFVWVTQQKDAGRRRAITETFFLLIFLLVVLVAVPFGWLQVALATLNLATIVVIWGFRLLAEARARSDRAKAKATIISTGLGSGTSQVVSSPLLFKGSVIPFSPLHHRAWILSACVGVAVLTVAIETVGQFVAKGQRTFYMLKSKPDFAVVRIYGDVVVASKVDLATEHFTGDYIIGKVGDSDMKLELSRVVFRKTRPLRIDFDRE